MRTILLLTLLLLFATACVSLYVVPDAVIHVGLQDDHQMVQARQTLVTHLESKGFIYRGQNERLLKLLKGSQSENAGQPSGPNHGMIQTIERTRKLVNKSLNIEVALLDFADLPTDEDALTLSTIKHLPLLQVTVQNSRKGGFSTPAHQFFKQLHGFLKSQYGDNAIVSKPPPATDNLEYYSDKIKGLIIGVLWWLLTYTLSIGLIGSVLLKGLKRTTLAVSAKRKVFTALGTLLATPLPLAGGMFFILLLPSIFVFPWPNFDILFQFIEIVIASYIVSALLCAWLAVKYINAPDCEGLK